MWITPLVLDPRLAGATGSPCLAAPGPPDAGPVALTDRGPPQTRLRLLASDIQRFAVGVEDAFLHGLAERRVREDGVDEFFLGGFEIHRHHETLDEFGDFSTNHVSAEKFPGFGVENGLHQTIGFAQ